MTTELQGETDDEPMREGKLERCKGTRPWEIRGDTRRYAEIRGECWALSSRVIELTRTCVYAWRVCGACACSQVRVRLCVCDKESYCYSCLILYLVTTVLYVVERERKREREREREREKERERL